MRRFLAALLSVLALAARADVVLEGPMEVGDNGTNALSPTTLVSVSGGSFVANHPIHFTLSQALTVTGISLVGEQGLDAGASFVVWDPSGNLVISQLASDSAGSRDSISGSWTLPAGDYQMAIWGQCFNSSGYVNSRYKSNCYDWDDFSFDSVRLTASAGSNNFHFIERRHIGDSTDASRWFPSAPSGTYSVNDFSLSQQVELDQLRLFNVRDLDSANGDYVKLVNADSGVELARGYLYDNGDLTFDASMKLDAGNYLLYVVSHKSKGDYDDISWDDIVLSYSPIDTGTGILNACQIALPYPAQGRRNSHSISFSSSSNQILGSDGGAIGYKQGQIKQANSQSCDGDACYAAGITDELGFPDSPFPLSGGQDLSVGYQQSKVIKAGDPSQYNNISTAYQSTLDIQQSGLKIKNLNLGSGRGGNDYTVKLASGDYWIENLTMQGDTRIELAGPVRLFVNKVTLSSASYLNSPGRQQSGNPGQLLMVVYDSLTAGDGSTLTGLVYQMDNPNSNQNSISFGPASYLFGRISARDISLGYGSVIDSSHYPSCDNTASVDHYRLVYSSQALTCSPATVKVQACLDADCSAFFEGGASLSLTPVGQWGADPVSLGSSGEAQISLTQTTAGTVQLGLAGASPSAPLSCLRDGMPDPSCSLSFADSGFIFDVPDLVAGRPQGNILVKAVKKDDSSQQCVAAFASTTKTLAFWSDYVDPGSSDRVASLPVAVNDTNVGTSQAGATALPLSFDSQGQASISVRYPDAGLMQLNARYDGSGSDAGLVMTGSDQFVSRPAGLCVRPQDLAGECAAGDASCNVFRYAGEAFPLTVTAMAWQQDGDSDYCDNGAVTPSYRQSGITLGATLLAPSGGSAGSVAIASYDHPMASDAKASVQQSVSEVGVFRFTATPPSYFGTTIPVGQSQPVGRFVPKTVALSGATLAEGCGTFTYMGQPVLLGGTLTAQSATGGQVHNYEGDFAKGGLTFVSEFAGADQSARIPSPTTGVLAWSQGQALVNDLPQQLDRLADNSPDGPFSDVPLGVLFDDGEGSISRKTAMASPDMSLTGGQAWGAIASLRYGRALLEDASGPEDEDLPLQLGTQYWNAGHFVANLDDSCTAVAPADISITANPDSLATSPGGAGGTLAAGISPYGALKLTAPGSQGQVTIKAAVAAWLQYAWDPAGGQQDPTATGYFGRFRGNDRQIYWQEKWGGSPP
ncbi:hypothetical protein PVT67_01905 [Gallaecimonas kandeliae]|uniref:DUF6701 domain-containing protein n=1 Tax=Gallaecimonas kandeliae TaxID=3029055 RepID=UPI00264717F2|nr:DUF6701 domain-containing protein [Gallaecimonas kandeliae]WKE66027.1 hypothetical protein PVT67_01905 [Gallaecimonas kandeliae]